MHLAFNRCAVTRACSRVCVELVLFNSLLFLAQSTRQKVYASANISHPCARTSVQFCGQNGSKSRRNSGSFYVPRPPVILRKVDFLLPLLMLCVVSRILAAGLMYCMVCL